MFSIYLITRLSAILALSVGVLAVSAITFIFGSIGLLIEHDGNENWRKCRTVVKWSTPFLIISALLAVFVPTTKDGVLIYAGGKTIEYIENHESIQETPDKVAKLTNAYIDLMINKLEKQADKIEKAEPQE